MNEGRFKKLKKEKEIDALVMRSTGSWYTVLTDSGEKYDCRIKGKFRIQGIRTTNPIAVGDRILFTPVGEKNNGYITKILPRHNYIIRKATRLSKRSHIIASNIDQAVLIVCLAFPRTSSGFIDRFLLTAEAYHIPTTIIFNKIDLYDDLLLEEHNEFVEIYENAGYKTLSVSAQKNINLEAFKSLLSGKISLLSGHSGVGKSSLINAIEPHLDLKEGDISTVHHKGKHTTSFATMHPLSFGGYVIDTPGIKEFGLIDMEKAEIAGRFPEFRKFTGQCRFNNCMHLNEPDCAIIKAVSRGDIHPMRYYNYLSILKDDYWEK
jgi:ribosome biogenesis GTPase